MTLNTEKLRLSEMDDEDTLAIVKAAKEGNIEIYLQLELNEKPPAWYGITPDTLFLDSIYRVKLRQLVIPWQYIAKSINFIALTSHAGLAGTAKAMTFDPSLDAWKSSEIILCLSRYIEIDTTGVDWRTSQVSRPTVKE